ncbi:MAG: hypothetical protein UX07_C0008G0014 [Parcubacteria group bacterium GW2011_GWA2_45_30]|nr:MAG: hypothetical protein UX07_C0008G0014 [Parcubacteria group bacterium GW2011_GWA2_45_30]
MSEELIEIFDENNKPTGEILPRSQVHKGNLWHRVVHIYIFRERDGKIEFLTHLRSATKDLSPNKWDVRFGGHIKSGASVETTAVEELCDEVGLVVPVQELLEGSWLKRSVQNNNEHAQIYFYRFERNEKNLQFYDNEVQRVEWMSEEELIESLQKNSGQWASLSREEFMKVLKELHEKLK